MKKISTIIFLIAALILQSNLFAQTDTEMKAWMEYMTPGPVHEMLAKCDGEWTSEVTMWMAPGAPPTKSTANVVNKMILGGRYQYSTHSGSVMGMPFEGISILGYDNAKKMLVSSWLDNMGTGIMNLEGTWDDATNTATLTGKQLDPATGKMCDIREVFKVINDKEQSLEMYMTKDGKEEKSMEIMFFKK